MGVRKRNPVTPGQRFQIGDDFSDLTKYEPEKSLLVRISRTGGRDATGRVSSRFIGGGARKMYRLIDFKRSKEMPATVVGIEYDPNRNSRIALIQYQDGEKSYILAPLGLSVGEIVAAGADVDIKPGNALPISSIPVGTTIHNIELEPGRGAKFARSAGSAVMLAAKEGDYAFIKLPSGEQRMVNVNCRATIGQVGNLDHKNISLGKAGKKRFLGRKPHNRGVVMNPCDHPHGGGEGKSGIGRKHPVTPWGKPALGYKTRKPRRRSDRFIISRRNAKLARGA